MRARAEGRVRSGRGRVPDLLRSALAFLLVTSGAAALAYPGVAYGAGALRQARLSAEVDTILGTGAGTSPGAPAAERSPAGPAVGARAPRRARPDVGSPLGLIRIPSIGLRAVFLEGVTDDVLLAGPGHLPGTSLPGGRGVSVIAGHRDAHFRDLKDVAVGDLVELSLPAGTARYRVAGRMVTGPEDRSVTSQIGRTALRLVTCWPPDFFGPAPDRLVVTAVPLDRRSPGADGGPAGGGVTVSPGDEGEVSAARAFDAIPRSPLAPSRVPLIGALGAAIAAAGALGWGRVRRGGRWWWLAWTGGTGVMALMLLAAWAGPGLPLA